MPRSMFYGATPKPLILISNPCPCQIRRRVPKPRFYKKNAELLFSKPFWR